MIKRNLLFVIAIFAVVSVHAQINKGAVLVGASSSLSFNSVSPDNGDSYTVFDLDVKGGYFIIDNLTLGLNLGYYKLDDYSLTTFGVFGRYYFMGKIFVGTGFNIVTPEGGDGQTTIPFEAGYAAFLNDFIAVEPALGLNIGEDSTSFGFRVGFTIYLNRQ